jgi:hypothetical protein
MRFYVPNTLLTSLLVACIVCLGYSGIEMAWRSTGATNRELIQNLFNNGKLCVASVSHLWMLVTIAQIVLGARFHNFELFLSLAAGIVKSGRVRDALMAIDRAHFCRDPSPGEAYRDSPQPIGCVPVHTQPLRWLRLRSVWRLSVG